VVFTNDVFFVSDKFTAVLVFLFSACVLHFACLIMAIVLMCQRENRKLQIGVAIVQLIVCKYQIFRWPDNLLCDGKVLLYSSFRRNSTL